MSAHAEPHHRNYFKIWAILVGLLLISVFGPFLHIRVITLIAAFGVAVVKAYLVAKNFMHLDVEKRIVQWTLALAVIIMVMLFAGVSPDVMKDDGQNWKKDAGFHPEEASEHGGAGHGGAGQGGTGHGGATHDTTESSAPAEKPDDGNSGS